MSGKIKENMAMLESSITQLKIYMGRFEKDGRLHIPTPTTDDTCLEMYLDWKKQVVRMQGTLNYLRLLSEKTEQKKSA
jgi:hypothetical protein